MKENPKNKEIKNEVAESRTEVHNVRFYGLTPRSILCMAFNKKSKKLAIARNDTSIEIWDMMYKPYLESVISGTRNFSVEGLVWAQDRLISVGLTGEVVEWDLVTLQRKYSQTTTGSACWCIDVNKDETMIAVGTEEGYVNIFSIENDEITYQHLFDKQEGRILCCKFDHSGDFLVTGSIDVIRIWNVKTGHALKKMTISREAKIKETIVWSLQVLKDFTIISGDSQGVINIWDGQLGVHVKGHKALKADILAVAVNEHENMIMCSGVEPVIRIYAAAVIQKEGVSNRAWVKYLQRSIHDHDIRSLICIGDNVIAGGLDGHFSISKYMKTKVSNPPLYGPFLKGSVVSLAKSGNRKLILLRYTNYLEMWSLGVSKNTYAYQDDKQKFMSLENMPENLLQLRSFQDDQILCSAIAPDGSFLIYSTKNVIRVFICDSSSSDGPINLIKVKDLPTEFKPANHVLFSSDSKLLVTTDLNAIRIFKILSNGEFDIQQVFPVQKLISKPITQIVISKCGTYLAFSSLDFSIMVLKNIDGKFKSFLTLPKYIAPITALTIHPEQPKLVVAFSDNRIFEYDFEEKSLICQSQIPHVDSMNTHCINNILYDSRNANILILHNNITMMTLEKVAKKKRTQSQSGKRKKVETNEDDDESSEVLNLKLKMHRDYKHFVQLVWASEGELVAVGINPLTMAEELPGGLKIKKFASG